MLMPSPTGRALDRAAFIVIFLILAVFLLLSCRSHKNLQLHGTVATQHGAWNMMFWDTIFIPEAVGTSPGGSVPLMGAHSSCMPSLHVIPGTDSVTRSRALAPFLVRHASVAAVASDTSRSAEATAVSDGGDINAISHASGGSPFPAIHSSPSSWFPWVLLCISVGFLLFLICSILRHF